MVVANISEASSRSSAQVALNMRITSINMKDGAWFSCAYQIQDEDGEWLKDRVHNVSFYSVTGAVTAIDALKEVVRRVYNVPEGAGDYTPWGDKELRILKVAMTYLKEDHPGDDKFGITPLPMGSLQKVKISAGYISLFVIAKKEQPLLPFGAFEQYVGAEYDGASGCLMIKEHEAIANLCNLLQNAIANELNHKQVLVPIELEVPVQLALAV
jgi:hypothetical protein